MWFTIELIPSDGHDVEVHCLEVICDGVPDVQLGDVQVPEVQVTEPKSLTISHSCSISVMNLIMNFMIVDSTFTSTLMVYFFNINIHRSVFFQLQVCDGRSILQHQGVDVVRLLTKIVMNCYMGFYCMVEK